MKRRPKRPTARRNKSLAGEMTEQPQTSRTGAAVLFLVFLLSFGAGYGIL